MFEKEAEEWVENNLHSTEEDYIKAFKDGAEFGYSKGRNEAKEIIKKLIEAIHIWDCKNLEEVEAEAEQFLRDSEVKNALS